MNLKIAVKGHRIGRERSTPAPALNPAVSRPDQGRDHIRSMLNNLGIAICVCIRPVAGSQETPIRITSVLSHSIVSGEMVEVMVEGMDPERAASESEDQLQVQIVQEGISRSARIRNVAGVV